jgi:heat-inducible transcriptional repressor
LQADGVQIFLGEESGFQPLDNYSLVTAPYQMSGQRVGVLGVIGSTRMPYNKVIPMVDMTAKILSNALNQY